MIKRIDGRLIGILFLLYSSALLVYANVQKPRILILHSYHPEFAWSRDVSVGLKRVLDDYPHFSIRWHHMDTKRHTSARFKEIAAAQARKLIKEWEPHVVIAIDDNAQSLVGKHYAKDPKVQLVYTGVNGQPGAYGYDGAPNVTGVLERITLDAVKDALLQVLPEGHRRMAVITDDSPTGNHVQNEINAYDWSPIDVTYRQLPLTFDRWKAAIAEAAERADFVLFSLYHTVQRSDEDETKVPPKELMAWTQEHLKIPGIGAWGFYVEDGGMLSVGVSPFEQGEEAALRAVELAENPELRAGDLPVTQSKQFIVYARPALLERHGIQLPKVYESFARATNNYYEDGQENEK